MIQQTKPLILLAFILCITRCAAQTALTLNQALDAVKEHNPVLKANRYNTAIAQGDVITAGLRPNPVLNNQTLQLAHSNNFAPETKFYQPQNRQVWWQLTKPFPLTNQRKYKLAVAHGSVNAAEQSYLDAERNILLDAGNKWLDVWYHKVTLDLFVLAKSNIDSLVQTQQIRLKNQVISSSEFTRTELVSAQYALQLKLAEQSYRNELQNLRLITGAAGNIDIEIQDPVVTMDLSKEADSFTRMSVRDRPDMQVAKTNIEVAQSNVKLQQKMAMPVPELGAIWNPQNTVPYVGLFATIELPFFSRNQGEIRKSMAVLQQSRQSLSALEQQVQTEVGTTFSTYQLNKETMNNYGSILQKSEAVLQAVKYAYTRGGTTIIDFLDAQRNWYDTRKMYYEALYNYRKSYLQLLYTTGLINQL
jgi:cobalt-zinc-cadmium efflux system outer membrane protein